MTDTTEYRNKIAAEMAAERKREAENMPLVDATTPAVRIGDRLKNSGFAAGYEPVVLAQSEPGGGDGVTRPFVVRLVMRGGFQPLVSWVYFTDEAGGKGYGRYCSDIGTAVEAYTEQCGVWGVDPKVSR